MSGFQRGGPSAAASTACAKFRELQRLWVLVNVDL